MKILRFIAVLAVILVGAPVAAQQDTLSIATIERPPFATHNSGIDTGFSLDLMKEIAAELNRDVEFKFYDSFPAMLSAVQFGLHDGAVANISITADREETLDFTQPIFESGIGVMLSDAPKTSPLWQALLTRDFLTAIAAALAVLFGSGMLMWVFERNAQAYFDRPAKDAMFPAFWWALNLVVNGGFEERMAMSRMGRAFSVVLVVASLFVVSIFVATITSALTVSKLQDSIESINDLEGRPIATVSASTSAEFLNRRDLAFAGFATPFEMYDAFEDGRFDAIVFDAPMLTYYLENDGIIEARMLPRIYRRENYGIALPAESDLKETFDQTLLRLREDGTYDDLLLRWFGRSGS